MLMIKLAPIKWDTAPSFSCWDKPAAKREAFTLRRRRRKTGLTEDDDETNYANYNKNGNYDDRGTLPPPSHAGTHSQAKRRLSL